MKKTLILILFVAIIAITLGYFFLDKDIVTFLAAHHTQHYKVLKWWAKKPVAIIYIFTFIFYLYFALRIALNHFSTLDKKWLAIFNSVVLSVFLKNGLKTLFGRTWPDTWVCHNLSFLKNNEFGFHWLTKGSGFESFPSGHVACIFSFCTALCWVFPKFRWLYAILAVSVALAQVTLYYHFLSDALAGATIGILSAIFTVRYCQIRQNPLAK